MGKVLTDSQIAQYVAQGYVAPIPVLTRAQADWYREELERFLEAHGGADPRAPVLRTKVHLRCAVLLELVSIAAIVDAVADVLGPDLLCRSSSVFLKLPGGASYVAHQDAAYWELEPPDVAAAWVALTDSNEENGALQVLPGSQLAPLMPHGELDDPANLLSRGQGITVPIAGEGGPSQAGTSGLRGSHPAPPTWPRSPVPRHPRGSATCPSRRSGRRP
jgi:non-haem Fe2+, alpha-ketoglutarate-dependent halogenase